MSDDGADMHVFETFLSTKDIDSQVIGAIQ